MEGVNEQFGNLSVREETSLEKLPFEILEEIFSYLPRNERLSTSRCSPKIRRHNEKFTWTSILVDIGDPPGFPDRTERAEYLFNNLPCLQTTLLKCRELSEHTVKLSLKVSRCLTYEMIDKMKVLKHFSSVKELSLIPPPHKFVVPIQPSSLRLDFHYDRSVFWALSCYEPTPPVDLGPYFQRPELRKLQVEHISFEPDMHHDAFASPQEPSPIEDLRFIDSSPQTVGVLTKMLHSVKSLKRLILEFNVAWPVVESFDNDSRASDWNRPGGHDYRLAISPHASSLEELMIAFSDGASFFIRPFYAVRPYARIPQSISTVYRQTQPVIPLIGNFDKFANLQRLAIPESLLAPQGTHIRSYHNLFPEVLKELQLQIPVAASREPLSLTEEEVLRIERLRALADNKLTRLPRLELIVCWYQPYASSNRPNIDHDTAYGLSWNSLRDHFEDVGVHLDQVFGPFFEDTPFGRPLNISHSKLRPPSLVRQGDFVRDPARPGLYNDLSTQSDF